MVTFSSWNNNNNIELDIEIEVAFMLSHELTTAATLIAFSYDSEKGISWGYS